MKKSTILMLILLGTSLVYAGREAEYSDKYPKLTFMTAHHDKIYFAGIWNRNLVVVIYDANGQFTTYISRLARDLYAMNIGRVTYDDNGTHEGILFSVDQEAVGMFLLDSSKWDRAVDIPRATKVYSEEDPTYMTSDWKKSMISAPDNKSGFPSPSYITYQKWRGSVQLDYEMGGLIGESCKIGKDIWFLIDFYDGEGSTGVGGIGMFDTTTKRLGVFRDSLLSDCSGGLLEHDGDMLYICTTLSSEYGPYPDRGLIVLDVRNMTMAQVAIPMLNDSYFLAEQIIGNTLWMLTDKAIVGWDLRTNKWISVQVESVATQMNLGLYRDLFRENGGHLQERYNALTSDTMVLAETWTAGIMRKYYWSEARFTPEMKISHILVELRPEKPVIGWVSENQFNIMNSTNLDERAVQRPFPVYSDSTLSSPIGSVKFGEIRELGRFGHFVKIAAWSLWAYADSLSPVYTLQSHEKYKPHWKRLDTAYTSMEQLAFATFEQETSEVLDSVPVCDTVLVFTPKMDLYDEYQNVLDASWLPSDKSPVRSGVQFEFRDMTDSVKQTEITISNGLISVDNQEVDRGYSWQVAGSNYKAKFKILDYDPLPDNNSALSRLIVKYSLWIGSSAGEE